MGIAVFNAIQYANDTDMLAGELRFLIDERGADIYGVSLADGGETPLHWLVKYQYGHPEILECIKLLFTRVTLSLQEMIGETALHLAAEKCPENTEILTLLIRKGADPNARYTNYYGQKVSPLFSLIKALVFDQSNCAESIKILLDNGADPDGEFLFLLAKHAPDNTETLRLVIHVSGGDHWLLNRGNHSSQTPLCMMAEYGPYNTEILKLLIKKGADVDIRDCHGLSPLLLMVQYAPENTEVIQLLIQKAENIDPKVLDILAATKFDNIELVELLIKKRFA